jgi:DNA-binding transcriptional regulator YdaS (Cro superfamily)
MCKSPMQRAVEEARRRLAKDGPDGGSDTRVAEYLGISRQALQQWERVPVRHVLALEALTGVSRHELRPDVYGPAPKSASSKAA